MISFQGVPYISLNCVPNLKAKSNYAFKFYGSFASKGKWWNRDKKKKTTFWRLISQEWLVQFTSSLICSLPSYAGICTVNLVLFKQEITKLQTGVKSYIVFRVNIPMFCTHAPFSWATQHTTMCFDICIGNKYINIIVDHYDTKIWLKWLIVPII